RCSRSRGQAEACPTLGTCPLWDRLQPVLHRRYRANLVRAPLFSSTGFDPSDSGITEIVTLPKSSVGPLSGRLKTLSPRATVVVAPSLISSIEPVEPAL